MNPVTQWARRLREFFNTPQATPESDPSFFKSWNYMPNPDPMLRSMGRADEVYRSIASDPHVAGEIRSMRGSFRQLKWRINPGQEKNTQAQAAADLCNQWMRNTQPNSVADWVEVMWQMNCSVFTGYRVHELVWASTGGSILPAQVLDRPNRRVMFDPDGKPVLISKGNLTGQPVEDYQFVISRHSPSIENPYGVALLSAIFYVWSYKTGGWRYFVKYCERHGLPWPIARYPMGTVDEDIDALEQSLRNMIENAYAVVPEGTGIELLQAKSSGGDLPQEALIALCNREISKALTGQAMIGEQGQNGSRAASETAYKRQEGIHQADRDIPAASMNTIFRYITLFNFGPDVPAPTIEFFSEEAANKERAETYQLAVNMGAKPSRKALLEELNIPQAQDAADELLPSPTTSRSAANGQGANANKFAAQPTQFAQFTQMPGLRFAKALGLDDAAVASLAAQAANQVLDDSTFQPALAMLAQYDSESKTLAEFERDLGQLVGLQDSDSLRELTSSAIQLTFLQGVAQSIAQTQGAA